MRFLVAYSIAALSVLSLIEGQCKWSGWLDRDNPSGTCDCEGIAAYISEGYPGVCENPVSFQARRISDQKPAEDIAAEEGVNFRFYDEILGFRCINRENRRMCDDYETRMCCSPDPPCGEITLYY